MRASSVLTLVLASAACLASVSGANARDFYNCSVRHMQGPYAVKLDGILQVPTLPERRINLVANVTFDGAGTFSANAMGRINGDQILTAFTGTYTVQSNCIGAMDLSGIFKGFSKVQADFVGVEGGEELFLVVDSPAPPANPAIIQVSGVAKRGHDRE